MLAKHLFFFNPKSEMTTKVTGDWLERKPVGAGGGEGEMGEGFGGS